MGENVDIPDVKAVFRGELDDIPPQESQVVRIFLSSTFTDYAEERNLLFREAIPELRSYCQKKGLDFQVSDMRWGVTDDATADHQTVKICLDEIENCQRVSKGPNFVAFLGNRYGTRSYPSTIEAEEFVTLLRASRTVSKDTSLLEKWYRRDDNIVPPSYILLPITTYFPHYNDESEENQDLAEKERLQWNAVNELLQNLFRASAACAYKYGEFTYEQKEKYFISITAREVQKGILKVDRPSQASLCFGRDLLNIDLEDKKARRFIDLDAGLIDNEAQDYLDDLRQVKVPRSLCRENIETKSVPWVEGGVSYSNIEHVRYLEEFKDEFIAKVGHLILKAVEKQQTINTNMSLYKEVLFHSHYCVWKSDNFCGRQETFNRIKFKLNKIYYKEELLQGGKNDSKMRHIMDKYLDNLPRHTEPLEEEDEEEAQFTKIKDKLADAGIPVAHEMELATMSVGEQSLKLLGCNMLGQYTKPVILYGPSGSGKTSMMAMMGKLARKWFEFRPVKIIRFLGISSHSRNIQEVLTSICQQIWLNYEGSAPPTMVDISQNYAYLVQYFKSLLYSIDTSEKPLLILLDSIDQLSSDDNPYSMTWLPLMTPVNVHIIVSTLPEEQGILQATKARLKEEDRYIEVPALPKETASNILTMWLAKCQRTLNKEQRDVLLAKLRMCPQPLFLKLTFEQAKEWHSYTPRDQLVLGITTRSLIEQYFIRLEKDHSKILTAKALGYMSVCMSGISDIEMEDVLSLDDEVLQDSYVYHLPPDPKTIRLPPLLWVRLKRDLSEYIMEQQESDGKKTNHWFHRQFREAAEKRYVGKEGMCSLHSNLVDYFTGKWSDVVKPLQLTRKKVGSYPDSVRGVPAQPVTHGNGVHNLRKMIELPMHLIMSKRYEDFLSEICYNFEWLYYKCKALGITSVKRDLRVAMMVIKHEMDAIIKQQEEERRERERRRKQLKRKGPDMEVGTSQVTITDTTESAAEPTNQTSDDSELQKNLKDTKAEDQDGPKQEKAEAAGPDADTDQDEEAEGAEDNIDQDVLQEEGDIFKLTSQTPRSLNELEQLHGDIEIVYDLLVMASSAISKDCNHLIMQILGTFSPDDPSMPEGLCYLRNQASAFVDETTIPLLYPKTLCLPSPGGELKSSIDITLGFPGDAFEQENKISLSQDGRYLYVVERSKTEVKDLKKGQGGDFLYVFDLAKGGEQMSLEQMSGQDVRWMELVGGDKYMYLQVYTQRDPLKAKYITLINHLTKQIPLPFTPDTQIIDFSHSGKLCLIVEPHYRRGENEIATQTDTSTLPSIEVAAIIDLESKQRTSLKVILGEGELEVSDNDLRNMQIIHGVFSEDEKFVVLAASSGRVYCFLTERGKFMYKWENDGHSPSPSDEKERLKRAMTILPNNFLLMPGLTYTSMSSLFVRNLNNGETIKELEGMQCSIGLTQTNKKNSLIATATRDNMDDNTDKDILVWNIERGELFSRCKSHKPLAALHFIGNDEEYLLSSSHQAKVVMVWYIGTERKPVAHAMPVHVIIGHSEQVLNIAVSHQQETLVTASQDNTVKLWSLQKIVAKCDKMLHLSQTMGMDALRKKLMSEPTDKPKKPSETASSTTACVLTRDSKQAVCATDGGWVLFIDQETGEYINCHKMDKAEPIKQMLATSDKKHVVTACNEIVVWDPKTGYVVRKITPVRGVDCMAENNNVLVTGKGGLNSYGVLYNLKTGDVIRELQGVYGFDMVCITSDATKVVTNFYEYPIIYTVESGQPHTSGQPDCMMSVCVCLTLSPCDALVASGSTDGSVRVMSLSSGQYKFRMQHSSSVSSVAFSSDSQTLVTAGFRNILAWSLKTGALLHSMIRHQDFITQLQFACNGRFLVSCSNDKQIIIWDYRIRKSVASFHAHCPISKVHVARDLSQLVYEPENVDYVATLAPNRVLRQVLRGEEKNEVPEPMVHAQAFALSFSSQRAKVKSSTACSIL